MQEQASQHSNSTQDHPDRTLSGEMKAGKEKLTEAVNSAAQALKSEGTKHVRGMAQDIGNVEQAFGHTSAELREKGLPGVAACVDQVSSAVGAIAERLRTRNIDELANEARSLARSNPVTFVAGSIAAGFVLARLLKTGASATVHGGGAAGGYEGSATDRTPAFDPDLVSARSSSAGVSVEDEIPFPRAQDVNPGGAGFNNLGVAR